MKNVIFAGAIVFWPEPVDMFYEEFLAGLDN